MTSMLIHGLLFICVVGVVVSWITELLKKAYKIQNEYVINIIVLILNEVLIITSLLAYVQYKQIGLSWFVIEVAILGGIISTGISIFGFDKFFAPLWEEILKIFNFFK